MTKKAKVALKRAQIHAARDEELRLLAARSKGPLSAKRFLKIATNPKSAWHDAFEWDDTIAARKYRLHQAEQVLTTWTMNVESATGSMEVRMMLHLPSEGGYRLTETVIRSEKMVAEIAAYYRQRLIALQRDAKNIALLAKDPLYQKVQMLLETEPAPV